MTDQFSIITTLVTGFGLALVFGWLAERFLKTPTLVGYIIAGVSVGLFPLLPNVDRVVTEQFAEIGVMLLMFGVGLHFSVADLVKVKGVAVTGAMLQMAASGAAGTAVALLAWDWALPNAIVFGMTLSCASTVVVMKALELHKLSVTPSGQVAIGWLVVQDLVTVFIMVCLPLVAQVTQGEGPVDPRLIVISLSKTLLGVAVFVAGMLIVGKRLFPWILQRVALSGSRELFTLCVLAIAIGIAYGAGAIFNVSYALGAFFAGMVMRESSFAHRAARNCLPLQDAFSVLFFISVGLMLDPYVFVNEPWAVIAVMLIIMCITSSVTAALVLLLGWPLDTALVMGACVSQLGEFSFILCGQGIALGIATSGTMSIVVAASILTIALNPLMFTAIPHVRNLLVSRRPFFARMAERVSPLASVEPKTIKGHVLIAGVNEVVLALLPRLEARGIDFTCFVMSDTTAAVVDSYKHGSAIVGNPSDPALLVQGHLVDAEVLVLPSSDMVLNKTVFAAARELKHDCRIIVRVASPENLRAVPSDEHTRILNDTQIASESLGEAVADVFGIGAQVRHEKAVARGEATNDVDEDEGAAIIAQARAEAAASAARHAARNASRHSIFDGIREKMAKRREEKARAKAAVKAAKAAQAVEAGDAGVAGEAASDASAAPEAQKPSFFSGMKDRIIGLRVKQRIADLKVKEKIENLDVKGRIERLDVKSRIENLNLKDKMDKIKGVDYKKWMPSFGKSAAAGAAGAAAAEAAQTAEAAEKAEAAEAAQPVQAESAAPAVAPVDVQPEVVQSEAAQSESTVEEERTTEVQAPAVSESSVKDVPASDAPADASAEAASEEAKPAVTDDVKKTEQ
ncbi:MAG: cation:proton antiporter [Sutterella wadsworthensis]